VRVCREGVLEVGKVCSVYYVGLEKECSWIRCGGSSIALRLDQELLGRSKDVPMSDVQVGSSLMMNGIFLYKDEAWLRKRHAEGCSLNVMAAECGVQKTVIIRALRNIGIIHEGYRRRPLNLPGGWPRPIKVRRKEECTFAKRLYVVRCNAEYLVVSGFIVKDTK
jgi:hypothetical protein